MYENFDKIFRDVYICSSINESLRVVCFFVVGGGKGITKNGLKLAIYIGIIKR